LAIPKPEAIELPTDTYRSPSWRVFAGFDDLEVGADAAASVAAATHHRAPTASPALTSMAVARFGWEFIASNIRGGAATDRGCRR
jgi:hypothetical protein